MNAHHGIRLILTTALEVEYQSPAGVRLEAATWREVARLVSEGDQRPMEIWLGPRRVQLTPLFQEPARGQVCRYLVTITRPVRPHSQLTEAQRQVAELAAGGATVREMAAELERSPHTIKTHLRAIYDRLGIGSRVELTRALSA